jgi:hypothetical protein
MTTVGTAWDTPRPRSGASIGAPWWPVAATTAAAVLAIASALLSALVVDPVSVPLLVAGYVVGAMITTALAATYRALRNARRQHPRFRVRRSLDRTAAAATGLGFAAGLSNAVLLATELAK